RDPRQVLAALQLQTHNKPRRTGPAIMPSACRGCKYFFEISRFGRQPGARTSDLLLGRDHHDHLTPFEPRARFDHDVLAEVGLDPGGHLAAELLVAHLAATEANVDLDLVPFLQEPAHLAQLDLVVALVGHGAELDLLDLDLLLLLLGRVGLLLQLEHEFAEIHHAADRRVTVRLDFDQVESFFLGKAQGFVAREHANHLAVAADHAHFRDADLLVLAVPLVGGTDIAISGIDRAGRIGAAGSLVDAASAGVLVT